MTIKHLYHIGLAVVFTLFIATSAIAQDNKMPVREDIEWVDVFMPHTNDAALPRILLIGNSITRGYYTEVTKLLEGKAYVARLTTSKSLGDPGLLKEVDLIMSYYKFDIVHFNNGLHGWGYTEQQYGIALPELVKHIRKNAPGAKLMWATITPIHDKSNNDLFDPRTERVKVRNKIALDYMATQKDIKIDDLWTFAMDHPEFYKGGDGTHPIPAGFHALAQKVAGELSSLIDNKK